MAWHDPELRHLNVLWGSLYHPCAVAIGGNGGVWASLLVCSFRNVWVMFQRRKGSHAEAS